MKFLLLTAVIVLAMGCAHNGGFQKPNVILILIDTLRADHVHCYGYHRDITPTLDSLAASGTMWLNVQGQAAWTLPAMATIFTGLTERQHLAGIRNDQQFALDQDLYTLPEIFKDNGYQTAGFYTVPAMGEGYGFDQGMDHCDMEGCEVIYRSDVMVDKYLNWADSTFDPGQPYFTVLHVFDPHFQYDPPIPYCTMFSSMTDPGTRWAQCPASVMIEAWSKGLISSSDLQRMMDLYDGEIAFLNRELQRLFQGMRRRNMLDNTLIVVVADHGEEFGDHGGVTHGVQLHREITGIPLIFSGPGITSGCVREDVVGQVDVLPTILSYAGLSVPENVYGMDILNSQAPADRILPSSGYYSGVNDAVAVRRGNMRLFWSPSSDSSWMYDLSTDPLEHHPIPPDSELLDDARYYWATPSVVNPQPMQGMEDRVAMFRNLGYLR